jgi:lysophospholipase L1-like esterase
VSLSSADPTDFGWLETTRTNAQGRRVSRFEVFTLGQPAGGTLRIRVDDAAPRDVATAAPALRLQRFRVEVPDGPHRLTLAPAGDGEVRVFGVSMERDGGGALVDALGVRGETACSWLDWEPAMAAQGLAVLDPDLVVLAYGTNEANDSRWAPETYRRDLDAMLGRLRAVLPAEVPCILVGPSDRAVELSQGRYAVWDRTTPVASVQREVAPVWGCAFWDWQAATGGPGSMVAWRLHDPPLAASDLLHFTPAGYAIAADRFLAALWATRDR